MLFTAGHGEIHGILGFPPETHLETKFQSVFSTAGHGENRREEFYNLGLLWVFLGFALC